MVQRSLDGVVYRDVEAVEGFVAELREAAYEGLELRHHIHFGFFPLPFLELYSVDTLGI